MRRMLMLLMATTVLIGALFAADETVAIRQVLLDQQKAWNEGNIEEFMKGYENSEAITFMGKEISRGYSGVITRYRKTYSNKEQMGKLTFSEIEVRMLGNDHALVLGKFALERTAAGGGASSGRYTLVARKTKTGWKFIHDHTS